MEYNRDHVYTKICDLLSKQLGVAVGSITEESRLAADLGADSLDTAELAMIINDDFSYDLSEEEMKNIKTVKDIVDILNVKAGV